MRITTRFAPSPTGNLHIGSVRTALYSWLFAKHYHGKFILRIEDTDLNRSENNYTKSIIKGLEWLGLHWDKGPYFQSQRLHRYHEVIQQMIEEGTAYRCFCSPDEIEKERQRQMIHGRKPRYSGICRKLKTKSILKKKYVVRFKNPLSGQVIFNDAIRGTIIFNNNELDDLIIQRSNGIPTYNFCVVIDDLDMKITHVIRGEDHINNTPRQINILKSLGAKIPIYAHLSMILNKEGCKLSKRINSQNILEYYKNGFLPEALLNYILRLGWSYGDKEIFSILEMQKFFNLKSISRSSSIENAKKLLWLNKYYINQFSSQYIANLLKKKMDKKNIDIKQGPDLKDVVELLRARCNTLNDIQNSCLYFYEEFKEFNIIGSKKYLIPSNMCILKELFFKMKNLLIWNQKNILQIINNISVDYTRNTKEINMILRVSITGNMYSPSICSIMSLIGKKRVLLRIQKAIEYIHTIDHVK